MPAPTHPEREGTSGPRGRHPTPRKPRVGAVRVSGPARQLRGFAGAVALALALAVSVAAGPGAFRVRAADAPFPLGPDGFAVPQVGRVFDFPRDHGSHPEFRIEWWYVTGHLWDGASNRFGFQTTFFRTSGPPIPPADRKVPAGAAFGTDQLFLSHVALLDAATGRFRHQELLNRDGWAAGAALGSLMVWNAGSSLERSTNEPAEAPPSESADAPLRLRAGIRAEAAWDLRLVPAKPLVVFGRDGVSRKGASPTAASHYLTYPRLKVDGRLDVNGTPRVVHGIAWMDHEFSSSQLDSDQAGWDWIAVQLHDGREFMAYRLRRKDGSTDPFSTLAAIDPDGRVTHRPAAEFGLEPRARWRSPRSGAEYPLGLRLRTGDPAGGDEQRWDLVPLAEDQELPGRIGNVPYWEGACRVLDAAGREVGVAFIELTGYAGDLGARLR